MKRQYMKPTTRVVKIEQQYIICTSGPQTLSGVPNEDPVEDIWYELE